MGGAGQSNSRACVLGLHALSCPNTQMTPPSSPKVGRPCFFCLHNFALSCSLPFFPATALTGPLWPLMENKQHLLAGLPLASDVLNHTLGWLSSDVPIATLKSCLFPVQMSDQVTHSLHGQGQPHPWLPSLEQPPQTACRSTSALEVPRLYLCLKPPTHLSPSHPSPPSPSPAVLPEVSPFPQIPRAHLGQWIPDSREAHVSHVSQ